MLASGEGQITLRGSGCSTSTSDPYARFAVIPLQNLQFVCWRISSALGHRVAAQASIIKMTFFCPDAFHLLPEVM